MKTYIGIKKPSTKKDKILSKGNLNTTWEEQPDGKFKCKETGIVLEAWQIKSDVDNKFLELVP